MAELPMVIGDSIVRPEAAAVLGISPDQYDSLLSPPQGHLDHGTQAETFLEADPSAPGVLEIRGANKPRWSARWTVMHSLGKPTPSIGWAFTPLFPVTHGKVDRVPLGHDIPFGLRAPLLGLSTVLHHLILTHAPHPLHPLHL